MSLALRKSSGETVRVVARAPPQREHVEDDADLHHQEQEWYVDGMSYRELAEYGGPLEDLSEDLRARVRFARKLLASTEMSKVRFSRDLANEAGATE